MFVPIKSAEDIKIFLDKTNALHDGYLLGVQFVNCGVSRMEKGYYFNPEQTRLVVQILVTSIFGAVVELEFENIQEWQIKDNQWGITDTTVLFDEENRIVWFDHTYVDSDEEKEGSYVVAQSMKWRIKE